MLPKMGQAHHPVSVSQIIFVRIFTELHQAQLMTVLITTFYSLVLFTLLLIVLMHQIVHDLHYLQTINISSF